ASAREGEVAPARREARFHRPRAQPAVAGRRRSPPQELEPAALAGPVGPVQETGEPAHRAALHSAPVPPEQAPPGRVQLVPEEAVSAAVGPDPRPRSCPRRPQTRGTPSYATPSSE